MSFWLILSHLGFSNYSLAFLIVGLEAVVTGGLHIDGLIDTADGIAAGPEKLLDAMRDSRVGAMGVNALLIVTSIKIAALTKIGSFSAFILPIVSFWARYSPLLMINNFSYISDEGNSDLHGRNYRGLLLESIPSILVIFLSGLIIFIINNIALIRLTYFSVLGLFSSYLVVTLLGKKLNGFTGDSLGACVVLVEAFMLFLIALYPRG